MDVISFKVGCRTAEIYDPVQGVPIALRLLYPTPSLECTERFGPYEIDVAMNGPATIGQLPLVVISHGGGGSSLTYRDLACDLVRAGYVVALPEHPGNSRVDNSLEGTTANLINRPRHICLVIDAAMSDAAVGDLLLPDRVALIGHPWEVIRRLLLRVGGLALRRWTVPMENLHPLSFRPTVGSVQSCCSHRLAAGSGLMARFPMSMFPSSFEQQRKTNLRLTYT